MTPELQQQLDAIDAQIAALTQRKQELEAGASANWPRRITLYAYCSAERTWKKGERLGLTGEALRLFAHFEEIEIEVSVAQDGTAEVVACEGRRLEPKATPTEG